MKHLKSSLLIIGFVILFQSCGGNEEKTTDDTVSDSSAISSTSQSTTITTPQNIMIVKHQVGDYAKWKISYDQHDSLRLVNGIHSYVIGRGMEDSNTVMVAVKVEDVAKAKAFAKDPSLKAAMQKGGVTGPPSISFSTVVYQDTSQNMSDIRAMNMFTVKDWNAWKSTFESNRQTRIDNGLTDRAYGYDVDDNHKVTLVVAINDTAKANAFLKSDILKQQRAAAGVMGEVNRFVYRVVAKY